ncbi:MAG: histidine kinase dimerization/phospho-acceptor domain-containing protein [Bacillota bacterium]
MKLILLISDTDSTGQAIKAYVPQDFVLLEGNADNRGAQLLKNIATGIVLVDTTVAGALSWVEEVYHFRPDLTYIGITGNGKEALNLSSLFYDALSPPFYPSQVQNLLRRSWERAVFLMQKHAEHNLSVNRTSHNYTANCTYSHKEHTLCKFSRALGTDFNRRYLIDLFISTLEELVPVSKISLLLSNGRDGVYQIAAQRGLDPHLSSKLIFNANEGLIAWLSREGRILYAGSYPASQGLFINEALQEMKMLHSLISIPLMARGSLVGALNLGPKVTGYLYGDDELEILYMLSGNVATALLDIELHHQLRFQKLYIESILLRMNSGVIAIDMNDKITTFNERAAEILNMNPNEVMHKDLRCLPSPLGDILYKTRSSGQGYDREELELVRDRLPLEISTYQLVDEGENMLGSVMIFDNISERRQLEQERRKADQLDVLNRFVGHLAHEIKNPMVAILTFAELLPEKYDDQSFRENFAHTVQKEVKRLNGLVEQLIDFSTPLSYKYSVEDIHEIVEQGLVLVQVQDSTVEVMIEFFRHEKTLPVRADRTLLSKAFAYLVYRFLHTLSKGSSLSIQVELCPSLFAGGGVRLSFWSVGAKLEKEHVDKIFDPLFFQQDQRISLGLTVSRKIVEDHGGRMNASLSREGYLKIDVELPIVNEKGQVKSLGE